MSSPDSPQSRPTADNKTVVAPRRPTDALPNDTVDHYSTRGSAESTRVQSPLHPSCEQAEDCPVIPGYQIVRRIGLGGMGSVYLARDPSFDRLVAIKLMHSGQDSDRFTVESKVTAQLPHPGIPPVYALGTASDGRPFMAMKYVEGKSLGSEFGGRDVARLVSVMVRICETIGFAHANGIVHRDIKPDNILIGRFDDVLVMDWGLAAIAGGPRDHSPNDIPEQYPGGLVATVAGHIKGTPAYMAPEQARGEVVDARADVFAIGGILAKWLSGSPPFVGDSAIETVKLAAAGSLSECLARLESSNGQRELVALAKRCLSPNAQDRPANASVVANLLAAILSEAANRAQLAERERVVGRVTQQERRKRRMIRYALFGMMFLLASSIGFGAWWRNRVQSQRETAVMRNQDALGSALARCEKSLRSDNERDARRELGEIEQRENETGAEEFAIRIARCRGDLRILQRLNQVDNFRWGSVSSGMMALDRPKELAGRPDIRKPMPEQVSEQWRKAFSDLDVVPGSPALEQLLATSIIRDRLLLTLDLWQLYAPDPVREQVLKTADPDSYRNRVRAAAAGFQRRTDDEVQMESRIKLRNLLREPESMDQPAHFELILAELSDTEQKRERLEKYLERKPGNLAGLMAMAESWAGEMRDRAPAERLRWCQAAAEANPHSPIAAFALGEAQLVRAESVGQFRADGNGLFVLENEAEYRAAFQSARRAFERATVLDPQSAAAWDYLGICEDTLGSKDVALTSHREACRLAPNTPEFHANLGRSAKRWGLFEEASIASRRALALVPKDRPSFRLDLEQLVEEIDRESKSKPPEKAQATIRELDKAKPPDAFGGTKLNGKVTVRGVPLFDGEVHLVSLDTPKPVTFKAAILADGTYSFKEAVPVGRYKVVLTSMRVAEKYRNVETSDLKVGVERDESLNIQAD